MRILDYATPRRLRSDVGVVLVRLAMVLGASVVGYFAIWLLVRWVVIGFFSF